MFHLLGGAIYISYLESSDGISVHSLIFTYLLSHLVISYGLMDIYSILWVIIQHDFLYFLVKIVPALATQSSGGGPCVLWAYRHHFIFGRFLIFWHFEVLQLILYICCLSPRISQFSGKPWSLLSENSTRNHDLGAELLTAGDDAASGLSQLTEQEMFKSLKSNLFI